MSQPRNRWLISVVLVLAVIGFVGFSMIPLISTTLNESQPSGGATPANSQAPVAGQQSKLADAARGYELVLQREPENQTALRGLVEARIALGDLKGAIASMEKLAALNPDKPEFKLLLAQAKQQLGDKEGAAVAYRSILKTQPGDINALQGLASLLLQQNQPEAAIGLLQDTLSTATQANQSQPGSVNVASVQLVLGQVYATQKRYDEAIALYDQVINADKQDFRPVLAKAVVLKQQGKTDQAKPLFENAAALAPAEYKDRINKVAAQELGGNTSSPTPAPNSSNTPPTPAP